MTPDEATAAIKSESGKAYDPRWRENLGNVESVRALVDPEP